MKYTNSQLNIIYDKRPDLIQRPEPTLNDAIVAFLKKYEVFVAPPKSNRAVDGAITGAVTGMVGADVGGDMAMIQGQNKQTKLQEWTSWKQWALDHKDFPKFQTDFFNEVDEYNKNIDRKLEDPEVQKELDELFTEDAKMKRIFNILFAILIPSLVGGIVFISTFQSYNNEQNQSSFLILIIKSLINYEYLFKAKSMIFFAIGAATLEPFPICSATTVIAYLGLS